jgi:acetyl esterase
MDAEISILMSAHLLTPRMAGVLERIKRANRPPFHALTPVEARRLYASGAEVLDLPRQPLPHVADLELPAGDGSQCRARLYAARVPAEAEAPLPVLLYFHGGGFVVGGLETHDSLCRQLAWRSGGAVVSLDYRLAPEHRFPAAWDDAWLALQTVWREGRERWGLDTSRIAIGGDSAGGTLAAATALRARDELLPLALQVLITPGMGNRRETGSRKLFGNGFLIESATIEWFFDHAIDPSQRSDWRFAPLEVDEVAGLSPTLMVLAECDPVVDDGLAWGDRLRMAGVPTDLEFARGVTHDFIKMGRALPESVQALQRIGDALREAWSVTPDAPGPR